LDNPRKGSTTRARKGKYLSSPICQLLWEVTSVSERNQSGKGSISKGWEWYHPVIFSTRVRSRLSASLTIMFCVFRLSVTTAPSLPSASTSKASITTSVRGSAESMTMCRKPITSTGMRFALARPLSIPDLACSNIFMAALADIRTC
jgi:hypothetical protein